MLCPKPACRPELKPCEDKCDIVVPDNDFCNCAASICVSTYLAEEAKCPPPLVRLFVAAAPCKGQHYICVPHPEPPICPPEAPKPECSQCEELVLDQTPVVIDSEYEIVTVCNSWA